MFSQWRQIACVSFGWWCAVLPAQQPGAIDDDALEQRITAACARLRDAGELRPCAELVHQAEAGPHRAVAPLPARREVLSGPDLHDRVALSVAIVGHYYLCEECEQWHFSAASGFWVAADGAVATCSHVLAADATMRQSFLVVADLQGEVWPVRGVLAADVPADVCVLETAARERTPLPLRGEVRVGERVACLSNPDQQFGFYSEGVLARRYLFRDPDDATGAPRLWLHVTCDFARGSSGAPVVDACGNVVGLAQSTTTVVDDEDADPVDTQMVFKTAAPAGALLALLTTPKGGANGDSRR